LRAGGSDFATAAAAEIEQRSALALKVTHALLMRARAADRLETCLFAESRAGCALLNSHDLYERIRAAVVDKDRSPRWSPPSLDTVEPGVVAAILQGTGDPEPAFPT
jgi:enoyl-CoA hydratase